MRGATITVVDRLVGHPHLYIHALLVTSVGVAIPHREAAAGHVNADAVTPLEHVTGGLEVDLVRVRGSRLQQPGWLPYRLSKPGTNDALRKVVGGAVWVDINEPNDEVRVRGRR